MRQFLMALLMVGSTVGQAAAAEGDTRPHFALFIRNTGNPGLFYAPMAETSSPGLPESSYIAVHLDDLSYSLSCQRTVPAGP
jgi:hypothetical protein